MPGANMHVRSSRCACVPKKDWQSGVCPWDRAPCRGIRKYLRSDVPAFPDNAYGAAETSGRRHLRGLTPRRSVAARNIGRRRHFGEYAPTSLHMAGQAATPRFTTVSGPDPCLRPDPRRAAMAGPSARRNGQQMPSMVFPTDPEGPPQQRKEI